MSLERLFQVNADYFELLESYFHDQRRQLSEVAPLDIEQITKFALKVLESSSRSSLVGFHPTQGVLPTVVSQAADLLSQLPGFWLSHAEKVRDSCRGFDGTCLVLPHSDWNVLASELTTHALYFDLVCVLDELHALASFYQGDNSRIQEVYFCLNVLANYFALIRVKEFFVNEARTPIAVIWPNPACDEDAVRAIEEATYSTAARWASSILKTPAEDFRSVQKRMQQMEFDELNGLIQKRHPKAHASVCELLDSLTFAPNEPNVANTVQGGLRYLINTSRSMRGALLPTPLGAEPWLIYATRQFRALEVAQMTAHSAAGDSTIVVPAWPFFEWKLTADAESLVQLGGLSEELAVVRAMQLPELRWLSRATAEDLLNIRKVDALGEVRLQFAVERKRLKTTSPSEFERVARDVAASLNASVANHVAALSAAEAAYRRRIKLGAVNFSVGLGITVASIALPALTPLAIVGGVYSLVAGKSLIDVVNDHLKGKTVTKELSERPLGILSRRGRG